MPLAPQSAHDLAEDVLRALPRHRRDTFGLRLDRWWDDLVDGLRGAYPGPDADELARHLRVPKKQLASWISGELDTPYGVFLRAVDFLRSRPS